MIGGTGNDKDEASPLIAYALAPGLDADCVLLNSFVDSDVEETSNLRFLRKNESLMDGLLST